MPSTELQRIADEFAEGVLRRSPTLATTVGDRRFDDRLPDIDAAGRDEDRRALLDLRQRLARIDRAALDGEDVITHHVLELAATYGLASLERRLHHLALDQMAGPQVSFALLLNWHTLETEKNARDLVARFYAFERYIEQYVGNLAEGAAEGRISPRAAYDRVVAQLRELLRTAPEASPYGKAAHHVEGPLRDDLLDGVRDAVYPAFARLLRFLEADYRPREEPGLWAVPGGEETYAELVRQVTQGDLTPQRVHQIGLEELASVHKEMRALGVRDLRSHVATLQADRRNVFESRDEVTELAQRLYDRAFAQLARLFGRLPVTPCRVIPIEAYREKDSVAAFYFPPTEDGSRPGTYYVNTCRPETRPRYNFPALTVHESVPGHHLQIAIQTEARDIPRFRRLRLGTRSGDGRVGADVTVAFTEGWGLYSERLGDEMGMYETANERFGMLSYQAWRAARLVVDTGIHALRWSRDRAVRFMLENVGLPENEVVNEVDRYVVWPAQALAYKIGQRHLEGLRRSASERLGPHFDAREFHDELLRHGALPLSTATFVIERWVEVPRER